MPGVPVPFRRQDGAHGSAVLRPCGPDDLAAILALQDTILAATGPAIFAPTTPQQMAESLALDICHGIFAGDDLAAYGHLILNRETDRNLGPLDGMPCGDCLTVDTVFASPAYRGNGFQRVLMQSLIDAAGACGARHLYATVSPDNPYSLRNCQSLGFAIRREITCYGGQQRCLLRKSI